MTDLQLLLFFCLLVGTLGTTIWRRYNSKGLLPPGPPGHPLIGHLLKVPPSQQSDLLQGWAEEYGDIFRLNMLGKNMIVVSSLKSATELMDKRSANYSDRPQRHMTDLVGFERALIFSPYGDKFRKYRRMFQETFSGKTRLDSRSTQTRQAMGLLKGLLAKPKEYHSAFQNFVLGTVLEIAYGHHVVSDDNLYVRLFKEAAPAIEQVAAGVDVLDFFPWLARVPPWVPGLSTFGAVVRRWRGPARASIEVPFNDACIQMKAGLSNTSFTASQIQKLTPDGGDISVDDLEDIRGSASTILWAGTETTVTTMETFLLAMVLFPEAQRKAQEEIDRVVGRDRLPDLSDRDDLPYTVCLMEEVMRWHPMAPLAVPHQSINDDVYDGFFIPAGSIVIPNVQVMAKDPATYTNPHAFCPERFLPSPAGHGEPIFDAAFGFGRRLCPGRQLAKDSVWIASITMLATFDMSKSIGADGKVIEPHVEWVTGALTSPPKHFECTIKPRSEKAEKMILQSTAT